MSNQKFKLVVAVGALLSVLAVITVGCSTGNAGENEQPIDAHAVETVHEAQDANEHVEAAHDEHESDSDEAAIVDGAPPITLTATEWAFGPETITAKIGEPVTIVLVNDGLIEHEVEFAAFGLHLHTPAGATMKGTFVPDEVGTFEFACEIRGHREAGMVGRLIVEPSSG